MRQALLNIIQQQPLSSSPITPLRPSALDSLVLNSFHSIRVRGSMEHTQFTQCNGSHHGVASWHCSALIVAATAKQSLISTVSSSIIGISSASTVSTYRSSWTNAQLLLGPAPSPPPAAASLYPLHAPWTARSSGGLGLVECRNAEHAARWPDGDGSSVPSSARSSMYRVKLQVTSPGEGGGEAEPTGQSSSPGAQSVVDVHAAPEPL
jgi:hypothetical protein